MFCNRRRPCSDACKNPSQQNQSKVRSRNSSEIQVTHRFGQIIKRHNIAKRGQNAEQNQGPSRQKLTQDHTVCTHRPREQKFSGSASLFLRKKSHGHGRNQKHQNPRTNNKKLIQLGITKFQNRIIRKNPDKQTGN